MQDLKKALKDYNLYLSSVSIGAILLTCLLVAWQLFEPVDIALLQSVSVVAGLTVAISVFAYLLTCPKNKLNKILVAVVLILAVISLTLLLYGG